MGLMDKIKKITGTDNDNFDYDPDIYGYEGEDDGYAADTQDTANDASTGIGMSSYTPMSTGISLSSASLELKVVKPEHFESVPQIADHLLNKRTVVLNLENTNKETARRLIDFLSGVAYSIDGSLKKIASNAYVITPNNVDVGDAQLKDSDEEAPAEATKIEEADLSEF